MGREPATEREGVAAVRAAAIIVLNPFGRAVAAVI